MPDIIFCLACTFVPLTRAFLLFCKYRRLLFGFYNEYVQATTKNNKEKKHTTEIELLKKEFASEYVMLQRESERRVTEAEERFIETKSRCQKEVSDSEQRAKESYQRGRGKFH